MLKFQLKKGLTPQNKPTIISTASLLLLFIACQIYPVTATLYLVAQHILPIYDKEKTESIEQKTDIENLAARTMEQAADKREKLKQDYLKDVTKYEELKKQAIARKTPLIGRRNNNPYEADIKKEERTITRLEFEIEELKKKINTLREEEKTEINIIKSRNHKPIPPKQYNSVLEFMIREIGYLPNLVGAFLAFLFPVVILAMGLYFAKFDPNVIMRLPN